MAHHTLPGTSEPYVIRTGEGERYLLGGQIAALIARREDTGGALEAAVVTGGKSASFPVHQHASGHEAILVLDGQIEITLGAHTGVLSRGDYVSVPPGTPHGYRAHSHYWRLLVWTVDGKATELYSTLGQSTEAFAHAPGPASPLPPAALARAESVADVRFVDGPSAGTRIPKAGTAPDGVEAYVLEAGEGERLIAGDQLFTFLSTQANTHGAFIALMTLGPAGARIPNHFHERHTETFFCMDGRMTMWANGEELALGPGDFLHVPAGTIHSFRLDAPYTRFAGFLAPGLFEPFFRTLCDPYEDYIYPITPGPVRFDRVIARLHELDLKLVDRPGPPGA